MPKSAQANFVQPSPAGGSREFIRPDPIPPAVSSLPPSPPSPAGTSRCTLEPMTTHSANDVPFEAAFLKLEQAVQTLEQGGLTLDQALAVYEEGMRLAHACTQRLDAAELKITELQNAFLANDGEEPEDTHDR